MKTHTAYLYFNTKQRIEFINITSLVEEAVRKSKIKEGLVLVNPMHITSSVYINDDETGLIEDYKQWLKKLVPEQNYRHNLTGEDNAFSHLMRTVMGRETTIAITNGKLDLGTGEQIFYAEFDGQRKKRVLVKIIGE